MGVRFIRTPTGIIRYDNNFTDQQKDKLQNVEYGAQVNTILGIKGSNETDYRIGYIIINKDNIGLGLVDNTPDIEKNVNSANKLTTGRDITIGNQTINFDGTKNIAYTLLEMGAVNRAGDTITGNLTVNGDVKLDKTLTVTGATTLNDILTVLKATDLKSTLTVTGATTLNDILTVLKATDLKSTLTVAGATTLNSTLGVAGVTTLNGNLVANGSNTLNNLTVNNGTDLKSTLNVTGATTLNDILTVVGVATLQSALNVNGATTLNDILTVLKAVTLKSTLAVTGATSLSSTLGVLGNTIIGNTSTPSTLTVYGASNLKSTLAVEGAGTLNSLTVNNATSLNTLSVSGASTLNTLTVTGASNFQSKITATEIEAATGFIGTLSGNASTATKLATARTINGTSFDGSTNIVTTNWGTTRTLTIGNTGKSVNGSANISWSLSDIGALPLTGGTMTGDIGIPIAKSSIDGSVPYAGSLGSVTAATGMNAYKTYLGTVTISSTWYNMVSIRHRNGNGDGSNYGMVIYSTLTSSGNLLWNKQTGSSSWQGERTILDSSNYTSYTVTKTGSGASGTWGINVTGSSASCTGNAATATKLATARTITLSGSVTGSASFDGSGNITIATATNHTHSYLPLTGGTLTITSYYGLIIKRSDTNGAAISYQNSNGALGGAGFLSDGSFQISSGSNTNGNIFKATTSAATFPGTVTATTFNGALSGNASTATKLATARTITLSGSVTGSASFDGSGNITISTSTNHTHNYAGSSSAGGAANSLAGFTNTTTSGTAVDNATQNGHVYVTGTSGIFSQNDGAAFVQAYSTSWVAQIYQDYRTGQIALRGKNNGTWQAWRKVLDSSNYTSYTVTKTGSGASGTWRINISGNAATATKLATARTIALSGSVTGSASFDGSGNITISTSTNHTHNYAGSASAGGAATSANWLNTNSSLTYGASGLQYFNQSTSTTSGAKANANPTNDWYHIIRMNHANGNGYFVDLATCFHSNAMYYRRIVNGGENAWVRILDSSNYTSYTVTKTGSGASGTWGISITGSSASCTGNAATATKLGTSTIGGSVKPIYLSSGTPTAFSVTVGGTAQPVYLNSGSITKCSSTVGSTDTPVYMNGGTITSTGKSFSSYLPLAGGTLTGAVTCNSTITFGKNDSYGIRITDNNYCTIGEHDKRFFKSYINYMNTVQMNLCTSGYDTSEQGYITYNSNSTTMYNSSGTTINDTVGLDIYSYSNLRLYAPKSNSRIYLCAYSSICCNAPIVINSDEKVKTFTDDIDNDKDKLIKLFDIIKLKSYKYRYNNSRSLILGFSAQDIESACIELDIDPEKYGILNIEYNSMISRGDSIEDYKFYTKFYNISYNDLYNLSLLKIKNLEDIENEHSSKLNELEERIALLEGK